MTEITREDAVIGKTSPNTSNELEDMQSYSSGAGGGPQWEDPDNAGEMVFAPNPGSVVSKNGNQPEPPSDSPVVQQESSSEKTADSLTPIKWDKEPFELVAFFMDNGLSKVNVFISSSLPSAIQWYFPSRNIVMMSTEVYEKLGEAYIAAANSFWKHTGDGFVVQDDQLWQDPAIAPYLAMVGQINK
jgi:hypothetical protein